MTSVAGLPTSSSFSSGSISGGRISVDLRNSWNNTDDSNRRVVITLPTIDSEKKSALRVDYPSSTSVIAPLHATDCPDSPCGSVLYTIHVMSGLLKSRSSYFKTMLASKFTEGRPHEDIRLTVADVSEGKALYVLLFAFYTNDIFEDNSKCEDADEDRKDNTNKTSATSAASVSAVSALDEEETQQAADDGLSIRVKNDVVQRLTCKELLILIRLADHYQALSVILPLALPVIRTFLAAQLSFVAELYDLPEAILQQEPARPLSLLIASKVFDYFRVFWKWTWSANRPLWVSLSPSAVIELLSSQELQVENEATVMDAVRVWMDERWKESGGLKNNLALEKMTLKNTVIAHGTIMKKIQWLQLPKLYLLHVILPLFDYGRTFSHLPAFRYLIFDMLSMALSNQAINSLPPCACASNISNSPKTSVTAISSISPSPATALPIYPAQDQCFRCFYPSMNGPRQRTTLSYCLAFSGVSILQSSSSSSAKCESLMQHSMGVQLQLCLSINEQRKFSFQFRVRNSNSTLTPSISDNNNSNNNVSSSVATQHYVLEMKLRVNVWNYLKSSYEPLQNQPFTVKTGQYFEAFAGEHTEAAKVVAGKTAEELISEGVYIKYGGMNVKMQITHITA